MLSPKREGSERRGTRDSESERKAREELCRVHCNQRRRFSAETTETTIKTPSTLRCLREKTATAAATATELEVASVIRVQGPEPPREKEREKRRRGREGEREGSFLARSNKGSREREMKPKDHLYIGRPLPLKMEKGEEDKGNGRKWKKVNFPLFLFQLSIPGIYLTSVMAITCVSVIMTVCVLNFFYRGPTLTHVPIWAQR
jgi:hypothetical protein